VGQALGPMRPHGQFAFAGLLVCLCVFFAARPFRVTYSFSNVSSARPNIVIVTPAAIVTHAAALYATYADVSTPKTSSLKMLHENAYMPAHSSTMTSGHQRTRKRSHTRASCAMATDAMATDAATNA
jgi:hypothetical protein